MVYTMIDAAKEFWTDRNDLVVFEFGVYIGSYLEIFVEQNIYAQYFGFDSFEGLPKEQEDVPIGPRYHREGGYNAVVDLGVNTPEEAMDLLYNKHGDKGCNITLIKKWYSDLTSGDVVTYNIPKAHCIHVDVDLYISTKQMWKFLIENNLLEEGCIITYDDLYTDEHLQTLFNEGRMDLDSLNYCSKDLGENLAHTEVEREYDYQFKRLHFDTFQFIGRKSCIRL